VTSYGAPFRPVFTHQLDCVIMEKRGLKEGVNIPLVKRGGSSSICLTSQLEYFTWETLGSTKAFERSQNAEI